MGIVLFHRRFETFTGGHLKVWHYYRHVQASASHQARIYFGAGTRWDESNPWLAERDRVLPAWDPRAVDLLFLGGHDWDMLPAAEQPRYPKPVLNLIQHVHHGNLDHPLSVHLGNRAIRICVSEEVREAIAATGRVNGPTLVIPNGVDVPLDAGMPPEERPIAWLICGMKHGQSGTARELARRLSGLQGQGPVEVLTKLVPRREFLGKLASARRAILLPRESEGFYLPALEAMALGALVICPDCIGNRSFCEDGRTAIVPSGRDIDRIMLAANRAMALTAQEETMLLDAGREMVARHSLERERAAFHELLASVSSLW